MNLKTTQNPIIRSLLAIFLLFSLVLFHKQFLMQFECYLTGKANIITEQWHIVILNIVLFVVLLIPLSFRKKANWGEYGVVTAFFVSLFIEMYGFPLTLYFVSQYFPDPVQCPVNVFGFPFLGVNFGMEIAMVYTSLLIGVGTLLIGIGWFTPYTNRKNEDFVVRGIYRYSRHPQYLGFILIVFGWFLDWPTPITFFFAPLLIYKYIRVCFIEEKEILARHPKYKEYIKKVPLFI